MMSFLENYGIKSRVYGIITLLQLAVFGIAIFILTGFWSDKTELEKLNRLTNFAPHISNTIHELQKERGASAGYIGSNGQAVFSETLDTQKGNTDRLNTIFQSELTTFPKDQYGEEFTSKLNIALANLNRLETERLKTSSLSITIPQMAQYYTSTISSLLDVIKVSANLTTDATVLNNVVVYISFLEVKERAGQERAAANGSYAAGSFDNQALQRFVSLIAQQEAFMRSFDAYAVEEIKNYYNGTVTGPVVDRVQELRDFALTSPDDLSGSGAAGTTEWFETITKKIDLLKDVEDKIANDLSSFSQNIADNAATSFYTMLSVLVLLFLSKSFISVKVVGSIVNPLNVIKAIMARLADGNLEQDVPYTEYKNEIGDMANAVEVFKEAGLENKRMIDEREATRAEQQRMEEEARKAEEERAAASAKRREEHERKAAEAAKEDRLALATKFEERVMGILEAVSSSAQNLNKTSKTMAEAAQLTQKQSVDASSATDQAGTNVKVVADASEEISISIEEITRQVAEATQVAGGAVETASTAANRVEMLNETANKIGDVINLINDIAEQTNLLALNATIEAARAGDAGKGFAVVASEVKSLASQTGNATEEIAKQITDMQEATTSAVGAVKEITNTVGQFSEISTIIASAVEEQSSSTKEITRSAGEAAGGTDAVRNNISEVNKLATSAGDAADSVLDASNELTQQANVLRDEVAEFLQEVRTG